MWRMLRYHLVCIVVLAFRAASAQDDFRDAEIVPMDRSSSCSDRDVYVAFGTSTTLRCDAIDQWNENMITSVEWFDIANKPLEGNSFIRISSSKQYATISRLQERHSGRYACRVSYCNHTGIDEQGKPRCIRPLVSQPVYTCLKVAVPPVAEIITRRHHVMAGKELRVRCSFRGDEPLKISFRVNRTDVVYPVEQDGTFLVPKVTSQFEGLLECIVHSNMLNITAVASTSVVVYEPPRVKVTPSQINVYSGTSVSISCEVMNLDPDIKPVTLSFSQAPPTMVCFAGLSQGLDYTSQFDQRQPAVIYKRFGAIREHNKGIYYCKAVTGRLTGCVQDYSTKAFKVDVLDRPPIARLKIASRDVVVGERLVRVAGDRIQAVLTCTVNGVESGRTVETKWYHNNTLLVPGGEQSEFLGSTRSGETLIISKFQPRLNGFISCSVNYVGFPEINVTRTNPIEVFVQVPPVAAVTLTGHEYGIGEHFNASCRLVAGNGDRVFTQWRRRIENITYPLPLVQTIRGISILSLENLNERDAGEYICVGTDPDLRDDSRKSHELVVRLSVHKKAPAIVEDFAPDTVPAIVTSSRPIVESRTDEVELSAGGSSQITSDQTYITIAIAASSVAIIMVVVVLALIFYTKRWRALKQIALDEVRNDTESSKSSSDNLPNNAPRPTRLVLKDMTSNPNYETVLAVTRSRSDDSDEQKKDAVTLASQRDDGIADCSREATDQETPAATGTTATAAAAATPAATLVTSNGAPGGKTSVQLVKMSSTATVASNVPSSASRGGNVHPDTEASDIESECYSEPLDRTSHARTSIRSFATVMREEGSRTPRGVIQRRVQAAGSQDADTYSLPRDACIQVIDPDDADYSAPVDSRRPSSSAIAVDEYNFPADGRYTNDMMIRGRGVRPSGKGRHGSVQSIRPSLAGSIHSGINQPDEGELSRSPSPIDEKLYAEPYAEPPSNVDAIYNTLKMNQRYRDICPDNIKLEDALGSGRFGNVYRGVWTESNVTRKVAVKSLKDGVDPHERLLFLQEAAIMGQFRHRNLVRLYGVVTQGEALMLVEELMCSDNLRQYLLKRRPDENGIASSMPLTLLNMCKGIADGMNYLANRGFVHRDLAARNIMLDADETCKIGDFGMSRGMEADHYESSGGVIPVKWSAPEAIEYRSFSSASDVWSYGIVLHEIWTFGKCPYSWWDNEVVMLKIKDGYRLPRPDFCPPLLYALMKDCWEEDKKDRPSFQQILQRLDGPPEALLRMPKALAVNRRQIKRTAANRVSTCSAATDGDNSDSSNSAKADQT
ncbi:uncharacterized protein LOC135805583 isoform X1 [Sycon ciliatum]|uniref:uncharacterized protein LOC135805583 isoform X1 n=1 Tax=Sycon ciliatum TaxID=27933 RepID=UPI0031F6B1DD